MTPSERDALAAARAAHYARVMADPRAAAASERERAALEALRLATADYRAARKAASAAYLAVSKELK